MISDILDDKPAPAVPSSSAVSLAGTIHCTTPYPVDPPCVSTCIEGESDDCSPTDSGLGDCKERPESPTGDADSPSSSQNSEQGIVHESCKRMQDLRLLFFLQEVLVKGEKGDLVVCSRMLKYMN
jgi:hypothetical protein